MPIKEIPLAGGNTVERFAANDFACSNFAFTDVTFDNSHLQTLHLPTFKKIKSSSTAAVHNH